MYEDPSNYYFRPVRRWVLTGAVVLGVAVLAFVIGTAVGGDDSGDNVATETPDATTTIAPAQSGEADSTPASTSNSEGSESTAPAAPDTEAPTTDAPPASDDAKSDGDTEEDPSESPSTAPATTKPPSTTTATTNPPRTTTATNRPTSTTAPKPRNRAYPTLADGSPEPAVAVYAKDSVTLTGAVPSEEDRDFLQTLAVANAREGQADTINNFLTVNPAVPSGVGVRVVELTSTRFPSGSAEIRPVHALELDRIAGVLNALPNVTALVIGHSDQRGASDANYLLSADRAEAVVDYLAFVGIKPDRLSSRAVGEEDLLSRSDDEEALQLNRRTEFILYGLLAD